MFVNAPVYSSENGYQLVCIFAEEEDGTFKRTQNEPLRLLRNDIKGVSNPQGEMVSSKYERTGRPWKTPTISYHYGRPQSFYHFIREKLQRNKFFVFCKPTLSGHISKFTLHELHLKNGTSQRKISILKEKYTEALDLWTPEEHEARAGLANAKTVLYKDNRNKDETVAEAIDLDATIVIEPSVEIDADTTVVVESGGEGFEEQKTVLYTSEQKSPKQKHPERKHPEQKVRRNLVKSFSLKGKVEPEDKSTDHFYQRFVIDLD